MTQSKIATDGIWTDREGPIAESPLAEGADLCLGHPTSGTAVTHASQQHDAQEAGRCF